MDTYGAGVVVLLFNEHGEILIGKRKGAHGAGTWSLPGGKLVFMKSAAQQIRDELEEETGIVLSPHHFLQLGWVDNIWMDPEKGQQHWVTLFTEADYTFTKAQPKVMEPDKCEEWRWADPFTLRNGRYELFHPLEQFLIKFPVRTWPRFAHRTNRHRD